MARFKTAIALSAFALAAFACDSERAESDSGVSGIDSGVLTDSGVDAGGERDAGRTDSGVGMDAGSVADAGMPTVADAGDIGPTRDAGEGACHSFGFGSASVMLERPSGTPPTPSGGEIVDGRYDLVRAQQYGGSLEGELRGTWVVVGSTLHTLDAASFSGGELPVARPRTWTLSTDGTTLIRTPACGAESPFMNGYTFASAGGVDSLLIIQGPVVLTYQRR